MKIDIFTGKYCYWIFGLVAVFIIADILTPDNIRNILWTVFIFIIGALCLWNYKSCGRVHCQITGYGFLAVGVLALLSILKIINMSFNIIMIIFIIVLIVGYGIEFIYKSKKGSNYKK